ncbi:MAG: hypothetical protein AAF725_27250 [Acidobacteriota bacterium]
MNLPEKRFGRVALESLSGAARLRRLEELSELLTERVASVDDHWEFFRLTSVIIEPLREIGHDLWGLDYDGEAYEVWGGNYMRPETAGKLQVEFFFPGRVRAGWAPDEQLDDIG